MSDKVYCGRCRYYCWLFGEGNEWCTKDENRIDTYLEKQLGSPATINKNNDCQYFEQKPPYFKAVVPAPNPQQPWWKFWRKENDRR